MGILVKTLIPSKVAETATTKQYTATKCRTIIDKFTATNNGTDNATFSAYLVAGGAVFGDGNKIIDERGIAPGETYTCPELVGHALEPEAFISTVASASSTITIRASGREITT